MTDANTSQEALCLTVPGLGGSGAEHWQTLWEAARPGIRRVEQADWDDPDRARWVETLHDAIVAPGVPIILIAHSLGCLTVAWWAATIAQGYGRPVAGALLVAPPDVGGRDVHPVLRRFAPLPVQPLPFPSILVASRNDGYATIDQSRAMARVWQSHFVDMGEAGHINAASGLGAWAEGQALLDRLLAAHQRQASRNAYIGGLTLPTATGINSTHKIWG